MVKNEQPFVLSFFSKGKGKKAKPVAVLEDDVIQVTAIKKTEKSAAILIRLHEPTGKERQTCLRLPVIGEKIDIKFKPFEIKSYKVDIKRKKISEVNLLEELQKG